MKVTLYKKDVSGTIRVWEIEGTILEGQGLIEISYGTLDGAMLSQIEQVDEGKAARTLTEQVQSRIASRIGRQRDKGYTHKLEEAKVTTPTNQLNLKLPMLAQKFKGEIPDVFYLQHKFDGNRCLVHNNGDRLIAYTRAGKENPNLDHILQDVDIPVGCTLDGELYSHGVPLQTIRSWVSRKQENTKKLQYMVYDIISEESYSKRLETLNNLPLGARITIARTERFTRDSLASRGGISALLDKAREKGYEGLILRTDGTGYEDGKRSKSLIKIKKWEDDEFLVTDIITSADGWAILVCITNSGTFKVSAPGTISNKEEIFKNKSDYIGKKVTVEYANLTKKGLPFHPVAIAFREDGE